MSHRIWRSPRSAFGEFYKRSDDLQAETYLAVEAYTDDELQQIAAAGFNGIWVHAQLHYIVADAVFPELAPHAEQHQERLNTLIQRAARHGIAVYLYMQPPRALPDDLPFWQNHPEIAGQVEEGFPTPDAPQGFPLRSLCTSTTVVQDYLRRAFQQLTQALPGLGGYIFITASEYPAHCWTRRGASMDSAGKITPTLCECPRCNTRRPEEVVVELLTIIRSGIRSVSAKMPIICWNWSWKAYLPIPCVALIDRLPRDLIVMGDFERGGYADVCGHSRHFIDEYSLGYAGPSEQFRGVLQCCRAAGQEVFAKLQIGTTHELATVVNLPLIGNIYQKCCFIRANALSGFMGCWNFGNNLSANTAALNYFLTIEPPLANENAALEQFAAYYFPGCQADLVRRGWQTLAEAMRYYPLEIPYLYMGPSNIALALIPEPAPLSGKGLGRSWLMDERGDTPLHCFEAFTEAEAAAGMSRLQTIWARGVEQLREGLQGVSDKRATDELGNAEVCLACWHSVVNFYSWTALRRAWSEAQRETYRAVIADELENIRRVLPFVERDSRQGFHVEAHGYFFNADILRRKIVVLTQQLS